ncbi:hypothetical protein GTP46_28475 [Duganella sp. FT135W]|uniref:UvrD-like helicase C-terminal domain-containing protein n=1 Tax=Duganella flavida TaxID=2692175 RepID=A0A6L8KGX6_9BURK|nr:hypothetical protein [Duganella flavida]MYM26566.1 hypothetical protein [Duganella flavida]
MMPLSFGHFDYAYCLTNHKSQGRTFDAAYTLANPAMCDRELTYVAASRSRFSTTIYTNLGVLQSVDIEAHQPNERQDCGRAAAIDALALRMSRSRAKGTSLDYAVRPQTRVTARPILTASISHRIAKRFLNAISSRRRTHEAEHSLQR